MNNEKINQILEMIIQDAEINEMENLRTKLNGLIIRTIYEKQIHTS